MDSVFTTLASIDVSEKHKKKNGLTYLPWASAWAEVKSRYPDATFRVVTSPINEFFWHEGNYARVMTEVQIGGLVQSETLAVMDHRNQSIPLEAITSTAVDKTIRRCLTKNLALFGLDLNLWVGEELSDTAKKVKADAEEAEAEECLTIVEAATELGKKLFTGGVISKDEFMAIVKKHNGNPNINSVKKVKVAQKILDELSNKVKEG